MTIEVDLNDLPQPASLLSGMSPFVLARTPGGWAKVSQLAASGAYTAELSVNNSAAQNAAILQAAIDAVSAAGGGVVRLPAGVFNISGNIEPASGVSVIGTPAVSTFSANNPELGRDLTAGTILVGSGSGTCFIYNSVDDIALGNAWVDTAFFAMGRRNNGTTVYADPMLNCVTIADIGFKAWDKGIKIGATNVPGCGWCHFDRLQFEDIDTWCIELINSSMNVVADLVATEVGGGVHWVAAVPVATVSPGLLDITRPTINVASGNRQARHILAESIASGNYTGGVYTGTTAQLQGLRLFSPLFEAFGRTSAQTGAATFSAASADIVLGAGEGANFLVGTPMTFTGGTLGAAFNTTFNYGRIYIVTSRSTDTIQVAPSLHGTAIVSGSTTSATATTYGVPHISAIGRASGGCNNVNIHDGDTEGGSTTPYYLENVTNSEIDSGPWPTVMHACVTLRNALGCHIRQHQVVAGVPSTDHDSNSLQGLILTGHTLALNYNGGTNGYDAPGLQYFTTGGVFDLRGNADGGLRWMASSGGPGWVRPFKAMGQANMQRNTTVNPATAFAGLMVFNGAAGQTITLPTITNDESTGFLGMPFWIINSSANTVAVATDGTQTFNGIAAKLSMTIAANSGVLIMGAGASGAVSGSASGFLWAVLAYQVGASLP